MNTLKLFFGATPEEARDAYKAWWERQPVEIIGEPFTEWDGEGFKLTVWYKPASAPS